MTSNGDFNWLLLYPVYSILAYSFNILTFNLYHCHCPGNLIFTGCFRVNEIMFLLISQPIKHLNRLDRFYIFPESIAFWCMISKKCHNHSVVIHLWRLRRCIIEEIWKIHWKSTIKKHQYCFANISAMKAKIFLKFYKVVNFYLVTLCFKFHLYTSKSFRDG